MISTYEFRAMGSRIFTAVDLPADDKHFEFSRLPSWFEEWEQELSRFRPDSELSKVNHSGGKPLKVSADFWKVLMHAKHAEELSQGLVTPVVGDALMSSGYSKSFETIGGEQYEPWISDQISTGRTMDVILNPEQRLLRIEPEHKLDFGGIAKGWAAYQAALRLRKYGPTLVNAGGDIAISSPMADGSAWLIGISDPLKPAENLALIQIARGGVATSGTDHHRWIRDGRLQHHIIDPRTGLPARTDILSTTVIAPSVMDAETHAKTVVILGSSEGLSWLESHKELAGLLVLNDGNVLASSRMNQYLWRENVATRIQ